MKIMYDYQIFSDQKYGGVSRYYIELMNNIKNSIDFKLSMQFHINYYLFSNDNNWGSTIYLENRFKGIKSINSLLFKLDSKVYRPDIIHHTYYDSTNFCNNSKNVITVYDLIAEKFHNNGRKLHDRVPAIESADLILCISENTKKDLINIYNICESKCVVTYLANSLFEKPHVAERKLKFPYILYVGKRSSYKNFSTLLHSYSSSPRLIKDLKLICFGGEEISELESQFIANKKLHGKVLFMNGNDDLLVDLYQNANILVYPSLYEGFGLPPLEAMSFGCPVVCSNAGSIPEVVNDAALLFNPLDSEELTGKIEDVVYSQTISSELIKKGYLRNQMFTWVLTAKNTINHYKSII